MKYLVHPHYQKTVVIMTDGSSYTTRSTSIRKTIRLTIDTKSHLLWNNRSGSGRALESEQKMKFHKRFKKV
jgi:large subunit ribosomal protein L31